VIVGVPLQFRNQFGPIGWKREVGYSSVSAARSSAGYVDENDGQTSLAENARELGSAADDLAGRVYGRQTNNAFLQVNHDQGSDGIEFCERHGFSFRLRESYWSYSAGITSMSSAGSRAIFWSIRRMTVNPK
jgi:hypothetical protein